MKSKSASKQSGRPTYREGTVFAVPLEGGGYGLGVVARATKRGGILAYFYGPKFPQPPTLNDCSDLEPNTALLKLLTGDLHLRNGTWPLLGDLKYFKREDWPMPRYIRKDPLSGCAWLISYSDSDIDHCVEKIPAPFDTKGYWKDSLYGVVAAERELINAILYGTNRPLPYQEGSVFAIPLPKGNCVLGVVARTTKVGEVAVVYIFGEQFPHLPSKEVWGRLNPNKSIARPRILDSKLRNGRWTILGNLENWDREDWPIPQYIAKEEGVDYARLETYKDSCPAEKTSSEQVPLSYNAAGYEKASLFGPYGPNQIEVLILSLIS